MKWKASLRCIPALKLWTSSARCWIRPRQLKKPVIGAAESCASWSTLVRWPNAGYDLALQANRNWNFMTLSFSFEYKMDFRKVFVWSPGNEDSITKTAKVPQAVQAVFFFFFFFFFFFMTLSFSFEYKMDFRKVFVWSPGNEDSIRWVFFFFFFFFFLPFSAKKLTHKQVRPRNVVVLISQSFIYTVSWHWPRPSHSAFFHNNVTIMTVHLTHCDVRWYERDNDLGRSGEITT